jgi:hypothetical protein
MNTVNPFYEISSKMSRRLVLQLNRLPIVALTLLVLIVVPVSADSVPSSPTFLSLTTLHKGYQTSYDLSVSISFSQSCQPILSSTVSTGIVCPMIGMISPSFNINGTLGWTVTGLNATTVSLNVTRDITASSGETITPVTHHAGSFNESINLATRIASILPFIEPEMDQALQVAQTNMATSIPAGTNWSSIISTIAVTMIRQPLHTMWWVSGPLKVNDSIPVLLFPTNVTGSTSVDIGGTIGRRSAWTLVFNPARSLLSPDPLAATTSSIPTADNLEFALTFNFDQTSGLLLSASADIHLGFGESIQPTTCNASATTAAAATVCPLTSVPVMRRLGIDLQTSLQLTSTSVDLSQPLNPCSFCFVPVTVVSVGGLGCAGVLGTATGNGQACGAATGPGSSPGSGSTTTGAGQPSNNPAQSKPTTQSASLLPWMYGILGIIAVAIIASSVWIARRRVKKAPSQAPGTDPLD